MNPYNLLFCTLILLVLLIFSCSPRDPSEGIPSYLKIDTVTFSVSAPEQGTASHKITDAWVYMDEQLTGTYEIPVTFPVLAAGERQIRIRPGIIENGIAATRIAYPFYDSYLTSLTLEHKKISAIAPSFRYHSKVTFTWSADFETEIKLQRLPDSNADIKRITEPSELEKYNGIACGAFFLDSDSGKFRASSLTDFPLVLPRTAQPVFLEMDYRNNNKFSVGVVARNPDGDQAQTVLTLNPSEKWNKIYVNLTDAVNRNRQADGYYFFIMADKSESVQKAEIYIDNLKILY